MHLLSSRYVTNDTLSPSSSLLSSLNCLIVWSFINNNPTEDVLLKSNGFIMNDLLFSVNTNQVPEFVELCSYNWPFPSFLFAFAISRLKSFHSNQRLGTIKVYCSVNLNVALFRAFCLMKVLMLAIHQLAKKAKQTYYIVRPRNTSCWASRIFCLVQSWLKLADNYPEGAFCLSSWRHHAIPSYGENETKKEVSCNWIQSRIDRMFPSLRGVKGEGSGWHCRTRRFNLFEILISWTRIQIS